jgi:lipoate-protein ligase B
MNGYQVAGEISITETTLPMPVVLYSLGIVPYEPALEIQEQLRRARVRDEIYDALIVLQHLPVITVGVSGGMEDLHVSTTQLDSMGVELYETSRGGKATFHGPGQLVAYPVMKLPDRDLHTYLWRLEETIIRTLAIWDIQAGRDEHHPGVWVGDRKICAIGINVRDDVTMHGLALNANTELEYFNLFTPCGIADRSVTSMQTLLGHSIDMHELEMAFLKSFSDVFARPILYRE